LHPQYETIRRIINAVRLVTISEDQAVKLIISVFAGPAESNGKEKNNSSGAKEKKD